MGEEEGYLPFPKNFQTNCIHFAQEVTQWQSKSVVPHIVMSTIFKLDDPTKTWKYAYSRIKNPNRHILERVISKLHGGKYALCFSSGMSALLGVIGMLKKDDHIVCSREMSGENYELFHNVASDFCIRTTFVDFMEADNICSALKDNTKLIWTQSPSNPTLQICDIQAAAEIAKQRKIIFGIDNTYSTPYLQRPLELGADLVLDSATKYINGHTDADVGCLSMHSESLMKRLYTVQTVFGTVPSPFDCSQVLRGMRTLNLRMVSHHKHSLSIANYLEQHPAVDHVLHPGLPSHPQHDLFKKQTSGHCGIISMYIKGGLEEAQTFLKKLNVFTISEVCGGLESTIQIPYIMSHKTITKSKKDELCITKNLVKLSIGLESLCDLIGDLEQALDAIKPEEGGSCK